MTTAHRPPTGDITRQAPRRVGGKGVYSTWMRIPTLSQMRMETIIP